MVFQIADKIFHGTPGKPSPLCANTGAHTSGHADGRRAGPQYVLCIALSPPPHLVPSPSISPSDASRLSRLRFPHHGRPPLPAVSSSETSLVFDSLPDASTCSRLPFAAMEDAQHRTPPPCLRTLAALDLCSDRTWARTCTPLVSICLYSLLDRL